MAFLIIQNTDGLPVFFSPAAGRSVGGGGGWTDKADDAIAFARRRDAQTYLDVHAPHVAPICTILEREVGPWSSKPQQPTEPAREFNAGDAEHVHERQVASKKREDTRRDGLRFIMGNGKGRAWMRHLLAEKLFTRVGKIRPAGIFTGNSTTFYNTALREAGDILAAELMTICPVEFRLMEDEGDTPNG